MNQFTTYNKDQESFRLKTHIQIAAVRYHILSELDIFLKEKEIAFFLTEDMIAQDPTPSSEYLQVYTTIFATEQLPYTEKGNVIDYDDENVTIWHDHESEYRNHYAGFIQPDSPLYAQSRYTITGDHEAHLEIYYLTESNLWYNSNIRIWNLLHLEDTLLSAGAFILHCCYTMYQDQAILFTAPSGTGKTTQATLWKENYGSEIINGDKAVLMKWHGTWYVFGYPYHGSAPECENKHFPIKAISIVRQSPEDKIATEGTLRTISDIYNETTVNYWKEESVDKIMELISDLYQNVTILKQYCTMNPSAAHTLHDYIYKENL